MRMKLAVSSVLLTSLAFAAEPAKKPDAKPADKGADLVAMMAAMDKASQLTDEHKKLKMFEGNWEVTTTLYVKGNPQPGYQGKAEFWSILGDRFVVEDLKATFLDKPVASHIVFGFDTAKKKYVSTRVTNLGTDMMHREGTLSADGKTLTLVGESWDPQTGKPSSGRMVYTFDSNDKFRVEVFETKAGGAETRLFDMTYTRAKTQQ